eukprot:CAMPEP_0175280340 /NCGR_PEP_ID=MMETSP0093-20121207/50510_1 /TAXON_ID=311494 /ORGANISM="Alexandrium monilatum, Strain CCMP3105" /LENGTH=65 /DNA_ID=CAMNT_0016575397 /DNA_START=70 /DNA_END=264 /DNA_ORIENTATION=-
MAAQERASAPRTPMPASRSSKCRPHLARLCDPGRDRVTKACQKKGIGGSTPTVQPAERSAVLNVA